MGDSALTLNVIHGGTASFDATNTLVIGEKDAVLIDVPIALSQAHRVVAEILESKRNLKYIYITHGHPDHYLSAPVFIRAFPDTELIALRQTCFDVAKSIPPRLMYWASVLGSDCPRHPVIPRPYDKSYIELEGEKLEILGPMIGDHKAVTAIHIPSINAVIASDIVFYGIHLFMAHHTDPADRKGWLDSVEYLMSLKPETVVAGHRLAHLPDSPESLQYCHDYLVAFEKALAQANSPDELITAIQKRFPDVQDMMNGFVLPRSARLAKKE